MGRYLCPNPFCDVFYGAFAGDYPCAIGELFCQRMKGGSHPNLHVCSEVFEPFFGTLPSFRSSEARLNKSLILETLSGIQERLNPRVLQTLLKTYLPGRKREDEAPADAAQSEAA